MTLLSVSRPFPKGPRRQDTGACGLLGLPRTAALCVGALQWQRQEVCQAPL